MSQIIKLELFDNGRMIQECVVQQPADLTHPIKMMTGTGWLDATAPYQKMQDEGLDQISDIQRVCHSYEKWGGWEQEVVEIEIRIHRITDEHLPEG